MGCWQVGHNVKSNFEFDYQHALLASVGVEESRANNVGDTALWDALDTEIDFKRPTLDWPE